MEVNSPESLQAHLKNLSLVATSYLVNEQRVYTDLNFPVSERYGFTVDPKIAFIRKVIDRPSNRMMFCNLGPISKFGKMAQTDIETLAFDPQKMMEGIIAGGDFVAYTANGKKYLTDQGEPADNPKVRFAYPHYEKKVSRFHDTKVQSVSKFDTDFDTAVRILTTAAEYAGYSLYDTVFIVKEFLAKNPRDTNIAKLLSIRLDEMVKKNKEPSSSDESAKPNLELQRLKQQYEQSQRSLMQKEQENQQLRQDVANRDTLNRQLANEIHRIKDENAQLRRVRQQSNEANALREIPVKSIQDACNILGLLPSQNRDELLKEAKSKRNSLAQALHPDKYRQAPVAQKQAFEELMKNANAAVRFLEEHL